MTATLAYRQKMFTFAGVLLAMFLGALDQTIVSTALPRIVTDLHGFDRYHVGSHGLPGGQHGAGTHLRQAGQYVLAPRH